MSMRKLPLSAVFLLVFTSAASAWEMDLIWERIGYRDSSEFGLSVSTAGDMNNDGYDDFLVAAPGLYIPARVYLYYGGNPPDTTADMVFNTFSALVKGGVDLNGDNYPDIVCFGDTTLWIYFGGEEMDTIPDITAIFPTGYWVGASDMLSVGGDVNEDGYSDLAFVDMWRSEPSYADIYLYFGGPEIDSLPDIVWTSEDLWETRFAGSIDLNGDFNNDGYSDLIFSNYSNMGTPVDSEVVGYLYLFTGGGYMSREPSMVISEYDCPDERLEDLSLYIGDINGDGFDDISALSNFTTFYSMAFCGNSILSPVLCGTLTASKPHRVGDLNRDGYNDFVSIHPRVQYCVHLWRGSLNSTFSLTDFCTPQLGQGTPFAYAGDVNGDGCGDLITGCGWIWGTGRAQLWAGRPGGVPGIEEEEELPDRLAITNIYPNPFNRAFKIRYYLPRSGEVGLRVYNILGELVKEIDEKMKKGGYYEKRIEFTERLSSGAYFLLLSFSEERLVKRVIYLK